MVHAEALEFALTFNTPYYYYNGLPYLLYADGAEPTPTLQVYGDNAEPRYDLDGATYTFDPPWEWVAGYREVTLTTVTTSTNSEVYNEAHHTSKIKFRIYDTCVDGEVINEAGACELCVSGYRSASQNHDQFQGCRACTDPDNQCPNDDKTDCVSRDVGMRTAGGWNCYPCPGGTHAQQIPSEETGHPGWRCVPCPTGTAGAGGTDDCETCDADANEYTPAEGFSECISCGGTVVANRCAACAAGQGISADGRDCEECVAGTYSKSGFCDNCPAGSYTNEASQSECILCDIGYYQDDAGTQECKKCNPAEGKYANEEGMEECLVVQPGFAVMVSTDDDTIGVDTERCLEGTYGDGIDTNWLCSKCDAEQGHYQSNNGASSCEVVQPGDFVVQNDAGARETRACEAGSYRSGAPYTECTPCNAELGQYQPDPQSGECERVPQGKKVVVPDPGSGGAIATEDCPVGTYRGETDAFYTTCIECDENRGEFQDLPGKESCKMVPAGQKVVIPSSGGAIATEPCPAGSYRGDTDAAYTTCIKCDAQQGQFQPTPGSSSCTIVALGWRVRVPQDNSVGATEKEQCPLGMYRGDGDTDYYTMCRACDHTLGMYQNAMGQSSCREVTGGNYIVLDSDDLPTSTAPCAAGTARGNTHRNDGNTQYTACKPCDRERGQYQDNPGMTECKMVPAGNFLPPGDGGAVSISECAPGTSRRNTSTSFTECEECPTGTYQNRPGSSDCKTVPSGQKVNDLKTALVPCEVGTKGVEGEGTCERCEVEVKGEFQDIEGQAYCQRIKPGYGAAVDENNFMTPKRQPTKCTSGTYSHNYRCVPCDPELGQYQDQEGGSFPKIVDPGHELEYNETTETYNVKAKPVKCKIGFYSKGSAKACLPCDRDKKEYQNDVGATYCKICARGKVPPGATECQGVSCEEESLKKLELRPEPFVFSKTAAGEKLIIPCDENNLQNTEDKIYRDCIFDEANMVAYWGPPNYGACPTAKTAELNELKKKTEALQNPEALAEMSTDDLADSMQNITAGMEGVIGEQVAEDGTEIQLTSRDVKDVAGTLDSIKAVITLPSTTSTDSDKPISEEEVVKVKEAQTALKRTMANTIDKVAASGEETLKTVDDKEKASIINSVEALASSMQEGDEEIVTSTLAVRAISMSNRPTNRPTTSDPTEPSEEEDDDIPLPVPEGMTQEEAPKLNLAGMEASGASVAVFSENAKDMFPDPSSAIDEDDMTEANETTPDGEPVRVNRTLNSAIVSLEFKDTTQVKFSLSMKTNTSRDSSYKRKKLQRTCSFLNTTTNKWSSKGCVTTIVGEPSDGNMKCTCNHNTSFAILLSISDIVDKSQEHATLVMFCINITFLTVTFLCIAPFKKYRKKRLVVLQTQLVLSLILANVGFQLLDKVNGTSVTIDMLGYPSISLNLPCYIGVILVQYLFLAVMAWMTCCAYTLYGKIVDAVKTFGKTDRFYVLKCMLTCWILPAILPTSAFLTSELMAKQASQTVDLPYIQASTTKNGTDCWVANPWKWVSFMIPMYICLAMNCTVFFLIIRVLIRAAKSGSSSTGLGKQIKGAVTIAVTVGVPWIVGVMTFEPIALVGQWLFIILTGLQGPVMFVVFVVLQEEVLGTLLKPFGMEVPEVLQSAKSTSVSKKSAASSTFVSKAEPRIDTVAAKKMANEKMEEEARRNVYANAALKDGGEIESQGSTRSSSLLVKCNPPDDSLPVGQVPTPLPTPTNEPTDGSHVYYECTHFPYDPDAVSLASQFPEPVTE